MSRFPADKQLIRPLLKLDEENLLSSRPKSTVMKLRKAISLRRKPQNTTHILLQRLADSTLVPIFISVKDLALSFIIGLVTIAALGLFALSAIGVVNNAKSIDMGDPMRYAILSFTFTYTYSVRLIKTTRTMNILRDEMATSCKGNTSGSRRICMSCVEGSSYWDEMNCSMCVTCPTSGFGD